MVPRWTSCVVAKVIKTFHIATAIRPSPPHSPLGQHLTSLSPRSHGFITRRFIKRGFTVRAGSEKSHAGPEITPCRSCRVHIMQGSLMQGSLRGFTPSRGFKSEGSKSEGSQVRGFISEGSSLRGFRHPTFELRCGRQQLGSMKSRGIW